MRFLRGLRLCRLFRISRNERGFSMIEVIMATAIVAIVMVEIVGVTTRGLRMTSSLSNITVACLIASDKIEEIYTMSPEAVISSFPMGQTRLVSDLPNGQWYVAYPKGTNVDPIQIDVYVKWQENNREHLFKVSTMLTSGM